MPKTLILRDGTVIVDDRRQPAKVTTIGGRLWKLKEVETTARVSRELMVQGFDGRLFRGVSLDIGEVVNVAYHVDSSDWQII